MKLLCIYDPSIILPVPHDWPSVEDAIAAFEEHNTAQKHFGFRVALTDILELAIINSVSNGTPATAGGMIITLFAYLSGPERERRFYSVVLDDSISAFSTQENILSPHYLSQDIQDVYDDLYRLIGWCLEHHPEKARYASWQIDQERGTDSELVSIHGHRIPIIRSRYDWGEAYRQIRGYPANLLPNVFMPIQTDEAIFVFCPSEDFFEDEQELPRPRLPRDMVESGKWHEVGGNQRGFKDRWGNFWMWNKDRRHWDVQITEHMRRTIGAPNNNYHLNIEPDNARIVEGFQPNQETIRHYYSI